MSSKRFKPHENVLEAGRSGWATLGKSSVAGPHFKMAKFVV